MLGNHASHTNAKYRRKHGEYWRKADLAKDETDDEAEIEVDVKEEECLTDSGGHVVMKVSVAKLILEPTLLESSHLQDRKLMLEK